MTDPITDEKLEWIKNGMSRTGCSTWSTRQDILSMIARIEADAEALAEKNKRIEELEGQVFVPGRKDCAKCGFSQMSMTLYAGNGVVGANDKPIDCPNGCGPCWPVTERDAGNEAHDRITAELDRSDLFKSQITELKAAMKQHHEWHQQEGLQMKLGDEFFDCADCYVDSTLEEVTTAALNREEG